MHGTINTPNTINSFLKNERRYILINFTVGPVQSGEEVRSIGSQQVPYFRTKEFSDMMFENEKMFLSLVNAGDDSRCVFLASSGTGAMEATIMNLLTVKDSVLVVNGGSFGARFSQICQIHHIPSQILSPVPGYAFSNDDLEPYENSGLTAFVVNMHETSTGVLYDMDIISNFCKRNNLLLIVDCISSFLADPIDMANWGIDAIITASQKALALPPGLSIVALSKRAIERQASIPKECLYFDFAFYLKDGERGQTPFTPAVQQLIQLHSRLVEITQAGGAKQEIARIGALAQYFRNHMQEYPFEMFSHSPSNAVTSILLKKGDAHELFEIIKDEYEIWICPNGGNLASTVFRVGHIGALNTTDYDELFMAFDDLKIRGIL